MPTDDQAKLKILLSHWIEHNKEHADEFTEWALKAKSNGKGKVHDHMIQAVKQMNGANKSLQAALERLKEG
jgi:nickel/cobalt exporter